MIFKEELHSACQRVGLDLGCAWHTQMASHTKDWGVTLLEKKARTAVLLSFLFCGLGHLYSGERGKGIVLVVAYMVSLLLMSGAIGFLTTPILWVWGMYDAYKSVERTNHQRALATTEHV